MVVYERIGDSGVVVSPYLMATLRQVTGGADPTLEQVNAARAMLNGEGPPTLDEMTALHAAFCAGVALDATSPVAPLVLARALYAVEAKAFPEEA